MLFVFETGGMSSKKKKKTKSNKKTTKPSKYAIGDVIVIGIGKKKEEQLARIRWFGMTRLTKNNMYGIEFFRYRMGIHQFRKSKILDGKIDNDKPLFKTNKKGYGTFMDAEALNQSAQKKWTKFISDQGLRLKKFNEAKFILACQCGSNKVVKHLLTQKGYSKKKGLKGFQWAIAYNHSLVVQSIFEHHYGTQSKDTDDDKDDNKDEQDIKQNDCNECAFFNQDSLVKILQNRNRKNLDLVLKFDQWPLIKEGNDLSNEAVYDLFCNKGNLSFVQHFIKAILQYKDKEIIRKYMNYPLMRHKRNFDSTMIHSAMKGNKWAYLQCIFVDNPCAEYIRLQPESSETINEDEKNTEKTPKNLAPDPAPLLLCLVLSWKSSKSIKYVEQYAQILLNLGADINWFPEISLSKQMALHKRKKLLQSIEGIHEINKQKFLTLLESRLYYYNIDRKYKKESRENTNHFITGSIFAAFLHCCSVVLGNKQFEKEGYFHLKNIIAMFVEYGAILYHNGGNQNFNDFDQWNDNIDSYPKNVCIYNNRKESMKIYWMPQKMRGSREFCDQLHEIFAYSITRYKNKVTETIQELNIADGLKFIFGEILILFLPIPELEFVDLISTEPVSQQTSPRHVYTYSSSDFFMSWS